MAGDLFCCPKESIEHGTKIGFYHAEFLGGDWHHIGPIINDTRWERTVFCNLLCISTSYLVSLGRRPQACSGGGARIKACTEISVTAFTKISISANRAGCTGNKPHDDISQPQARKTPAKRS
jgi:hypothetical protein